MDTSTKWRISLPIQKWYGKKVGFLGCVFRQEFLAYQNHNGLIVVSQYDSDKISEYMEVISLKNGSLVTTSYGSRSISSWDTGLRNQLKWYDYSVLTPFK